MQFYFVHVDSMVFTKLRDLTILNLAFITREGRTAYYIAR